MSGTADGKMGDHVLLAPPYIINEDEIHSVTTLLAESIEEALGCIKG
jgi:adenosylmethionine-8-amino-7-oxononanoate aminotransferase